MSEKTRQEVLAKKRGRYARAGKEHKGKILDEVILNPAVEVDGS